MNLAHHSGHFDLSGVEPELQETVRERLMAIAEYERSPTRKHATALALRIGLKTAAFYNLVKAWRTLRDPLQIVGRTRPRTKKIDLDQRVQALLDKIIEEYPTSRTDELIKQAETRAESQGVPIPDRLKIKRYLAQSRPKILPTEVALRGDLIVEHTVVEVPVCDPGNQFPLRPMATVVLDSQHNIIRALELSHGTPTAAKMGSALKIALAAMKEEGPLKGGSTKIRISLLELEDDHLPALASALKNDGFEVSCYRAGKYEHGIGLESLLGQIHKGLRFLPRLVTAPAERRRVMHRKAGRSPMKLEEAEALVRSRLGLKASFPDKLS